MQTPEELLKAEVAGASDIQQGIKELTPQRERPEMFNSCGLPITGGQIYSSPCRTPRIGHYEGWY